MHWNVTNLPMDHNAYVRELYEQKDHAFLTDYFRWYLLREYGGSYFDADLEVVNGSHYRNLIEELEAAPNYDAVIGIDERSGGWYTAHSMASKPGSDIANFMCDLYESFGKFTAWRKRCMFLWAPQLVALYFADRGFHKDSMGTMPHLTSPQVVERVKVYPQEWFSPLAPSGSPDKPFNLNGYNGNTTLCHHFACSWHDESSIYLAHAREKGGQARVLLRELVTAEGFGIVTENYSPDALHMGFVPGGQHLKSQIGTVNGLVCATTGRAGYLIYGLSQSIAKGRYRACFRLADITSPGVVTIDITDQSGSKSIGQAKITLPADASQGAVYCDFELETDVEDLDCRLSVEAQSEFLVTELTIDRDTGAHPAG
jgi:hypothetical protein